MRRSPSTLEGKPLDMAARLAEFEAFACAVVGSCRGLILNCVQWYIDNPFEPGESGDPDRIFF